MAWQYPTQSSQLNAGPSQPSYGVFRPNNGTPTQGPGNVPPLYAAPGPTSPQSSQSPPQPPPQPPQLPRPFIHTPQKRTSQSTCLMIVLLQVLCALIVYRSNSLSSYVQLEIGARRASREASALVAEREKLEVERENMRHDREIWERERVPKEPPVPPSGWTIRPANECRAYGMREYSGALQHIARGWSAFDACMNTPVRINHVTIQHPHRCGFENGSPHIHGYWMVDWGQDDCKPKHEGVRDVGCTNYRSGLTRIEARVVGIRGGKEQDWRVMCESTPFTWDGVTYSSPSRCEERGLGTKVAVWDVPAESCRY